MHSSPTWIPSVLRLPTTFKVSSPYVSENCQTIYGPMASNATEIYKGWDQQHYSQGSALRPTRCSLGNEINPCQQDKATVKTSEVVGL